MSVQTFVLLYSLPLLAFWLRYSARPPAGPADVRRLALLVLATGLLLRIALLWHGGFHYDTGTYKAWALKLSDPQAPWQIYQPGYFADYPPLYMYVLAALGWLARQLGLESSTHFTALIKLPALCADLLVGLLIYRHAARSALDDRTHHRTGLIAAALYWLNPAVMLDSALWGQTESILALLLVSAWVGWKQGRLGFSALLLGAAIAFKPQGLIFACVGGLAVLLSQPLIATLRQILIGLASFILIILPFALDQDLDWIFRLYFNTAETYNYLSVNAYNVWALWGWNWAAEPGRWLGLDIQLWALILATGGLTLTGLFSGLALRANTDPARRAEIAAWAFVLATMIMFMLAPRMHERYVLSLLPLLCLLSGSRIHRLLLVLWTLGSLANLAYVYHFYIDIGETAPPDSRFVRAVSGFNLALAMLTLAVRYSAARVDAGLSWLLTRLHRIPAIPQSPRQDAAPALPQRLLPYLVLGGAALFLGTWRLGNIDHPVHGRTMANETLHFALPEAQALSKLLVFGAHGEGTLQLEYRHQGDWHVLLEEREFKDFYKLHELSLEAAPPSREYRLQAGASHEAFQLLEVGLLDAQDRPLVPVSSDAPELFDEARTWRAGQGYLASTYFDEIYHARTAYEYLHRQPVYETTHPPLGKWLIAQGIRSFGMNPWGMRIMGVLATCAIVLALIWGAGMLTGSLRAMWLSGLLALFEFSRFAIGRYSTIDSFLILFILLAALFIWRAFCRNPTVAWQAGWRRTPDLAAAGLCLGAAIAVKWSALYLGIGIFALFLISLARSISSPDPGRSPPGHLMISASLCFGLLPLCVYLLSYIPFLRCLPEAPALLSLDGIHQIWQSQRSMFAYHAHLSSSHPFSSGFYTWPLALKPLWLYVDETRLPLRSSITLMGNPAIWWGGLILLVALLFQRLAWPQRDRLWLLACLATLYLPWCLVSRISFIYHYYPLVPFLILLLAVSLHRLPIETARARVLPWLVIGMSAVLFVLFFPSISGLPVPASWTIWLRWLPGWWML